jgi:GDPmannose 4,6-dehydratase
MRDDYAIRRAVDDAAPDEIYNLAGVSSLREADADPAATFDINLNGLQRLLDASDDSTRICQASSALIFGPPDGRARNETTPLAPEGPYAEAKAGAHGLIGDARQRGRHAVSMILFNHESPLRSTRFVTRRVTRGVAEIVAGKRDLLELDSLEAQRDWGFAGDYVNAMRLAMGNDRPDDFVIATGVVHTVRDVVETAFTAAGIGQWEGRVKAGDTTTDACSPGDPSKARAVLGWAPEVDFAGLISMMVRHDLETV